MKRQRVSPKFKRELEAEVRRLVEQHKTPVDKVFYFVAKNRGVSLRTLVTLTGFSRQTVMNALRILVRKGKIKSSNKVFYSTGPFPVPGLKDW